MRKIAGILTIIGGFIGGSLFIGILNSIGIYGGLLILPAILAVLGGYFTLRGTHWGWALTGAICSLLFPITGIPAIILLIKRRSDFEQ